MNLARAAYHEQSLGHGLDDYYSEWGERPGLWWGGGAELLGLEGYAAPGSIVSLIEGRDPLSGELLRRPTSSALVTRRVFDPASGGVVERQVEQKRVGGWDFAFSAPKSISLALTFGDAETRRELLAAHRAAVEAALRAARVRGGARARRRARRVPARDAWLAGGRDRARLGARRQRGCDARPAAPHPRRRREHGQEPRGRRRVVAHARHATRPARMEARRERDLPGGASARGLVAARLGVGRAAQRPRRAQAMADQRAARVQPATRADRSVPGRRRDRPGHAPKRPRSRRARPRARPATRPPTAPPRAHGSANTSTRASSPRCSRPDATRRRRWTRVDSAASSSGSLGEHGLTERDSSFTRGDVVRELAFALGSVPDTDALLVCSRLVPRARAGRALDERRFTTRGLQAAEQRITRLAQRPRPAQLVLAPAQADVGIERTESERGFALSDEQRALVHGVTRRPGSVSLVRAVAGSGKTTTLAAIARAYEHAGIPVAGVAPTGAAARVMSEAGIPARTVERALLDREQALRAGIRPTPGIVLVDEAGTIGTRTLARLAEAVALADAKLVLVGDDAQLPAVAAGAAYANLLEQPATGALARDTAALPHARPASPTSPKHARSPASAPARSKAPPPTSTTSNRPARSAPSTAPPRSSAAAAWHADASRGGRRPGTHRTDRAQPRASQPAQPTRARLHARRRPPRARRPRPHAAYRSPSETSSSAAETTAASPSPTAPAGASRRSRRRDHARDDRSAQLSHPRGYARAGALEHAYAITGHLAQAATFDAAMVVAPPHHHTQQWSYTALSRSRTPTQLVLVTDAPREQPAEHAAPFDPLTTPTHSRARDLPHA